MDIGRAAALRERVDMNKFSALAKYRTSPLFSERERAALAYVDEATRNKRVSGATFEALRRNFSEAEIVEIPYINALENLYNLINIPLEVEPDGLCAIAQRNEEIRHDTPQKKASRPRVRRRKGRVGIPRSLREVRAASDQWEAIR